jgi:hypothetical protein
MRRDVVAPTMRRSHFDDMEVHMAHRNAHGSSLREMSPESINARPSDDVVERVKRDPGKFGRMFPGLEPLRVADAQLTALANAMKDPNPGSPAGNNPNITAGFTYLGQFVDHDITLDTTPLAQQQADPLAIRNFRSPSVDLDSLYGQGPGVSPELYARSAATFGMLPEMLVGKASQSPSPTGVDIPLLPNDLPRNRFGRALIGDERNDENLLVAQTHLLFIKFHNAVVAHLRATRPDIAGSGTALFEEAKRIVTWHYQWIVLFDFVERLTEPGLVNQIRQRGRKFYRFDTTPYMPVEFAAAAYRLGHSMVREAYSHNRVFRFGQGAFAPATFDFLFQFTGKSGEIIGDLVDGPGTGPSRGPAPGPFRELPSNWVIDWRRYYDLGTPANTPNFGLNLSRRIDPFLVPALHTLPGGGGSLPLRNLQRGVMLGLPSGQAVANAMRVQPLTAAQLSSGTDGAVALQEGLVDATPLWYYILKEAEQFHQGMRLGPVGSTIVAETFLGIVHGDHQSFMWRRANWKPELPAAVPGTFTMVDLINFVNDVNPLGD